MSDVIDRNLALELARVTESAALASAAWMGKGSKEDADQAAVDAMRYFLGSVEMDGVVVIGEGAKDEAPMLYVGEQVGTGEPPKGRYCGRSRRGDAAVGQWDAKCDCGCCAVGSRHDVHEPGYRLYAENCRRPGGG